VSTHYRQLCHRAGQQQNKIDKSAIVFKKRNEQPYVVEIAQQRPPPRQTLIQLFLCSSARATSTDPLAPVSK
jgi:hypothetical protein